MIPRIRRGNDFKYIWPITWNGQPEDFSDATDITLTAKVYGRVKTLTEGVNYHIDGGTVMIDFTPVICDIAGPYTVELNYIKPSAEFLDGDRRSAVDVQAFQIVNASAEANATEGCSPPSEAMVAYALKYDDLTEEQKNELRGKGITSIDLTAEDGDVKTYTITYADGLTFDFPVRDGHSPIFSFDGTTLLIDGVPQFDLKGETGNGIASVELTSTVGLVKTYTITFTDDTTTTFTVTDGAAAVVQEKGSNTGIVMSQKAVTDELAAKAAHGYTDSPKTLKQVDDSLDQLAGEVSQIELDVNQIELDVSQIELDVSQIELDVSQIEVKDAIQDSKIKDIENVLSTANLGQSAQLSVSGVSPLSLPKNAANGGMIVKLEGLTEDIGGVTTNFEPTGRIRSVGKNLFNPKSVTTKRNLDNRDVVDIIGYLGALDTSLYSNGIYYINSGVKKLIGLPFKASTQYTISLDARYIAGAEGNFVIRFHYSDGTNNHTFGTTSVWGNRKMTSVAGKSVVAISLEGSGGFHHIAVDINTIDVENSVSISGFAPYRETSLYLTAPELRSNGTVKDEIRKGANGYELVKRISEVDGTVLANPVISPISFGGVLNSASNGTVYHEPIIADAGVYGANLPILMADYPIASIEEIIKHENGVDTYLNVATAVIASDGLSFTHPDLADGDLVLFTYAYDKESTNGNITATFYDSNVVKIDTVTGKAYRINEVVTNGILTRTLTPV